ncbi:MAG: hypothetical protein JRH20_26000, partial [Deltaproteobacteria bacterium]|nr:hypothetical protein [Deltaproteobacteria bacterium]
MQVYVSSGLVILFLMGCGGETLHLGVAHVAVKAKDEVGAAVSLMDDKGEPIDLDSEDVDVQVQTREEDGDWGDALALQLGKQGTGLVDVVLVADNSGSEKSYLTEIREAV